MYHKLEDFIKDWKHESESTLKIFNNLTDESLTKKVNENVRTAGRLAWHITTSIGEMAHRTGLIFKTVDSHSSVPAKAIEIVDAYKETSENLLEAGKANWNDESLFVEDDMYGEKLTVVMRLNGLKVPGVYGPSKEEWMTYGMPAQE